MWKRYLGNLKTKMKDIVNWNQDWDKWKINY